MRDERIAIGYEEIDDPFHLPLELVPGCLPHLQAFAYHLQPVRGTPVRARNETRAQRLPRFDFNVECNHTASVYSINMTGPRLALVTTSSCSRGIVRSSGTPTCVVVEVMVNSSRREQWTGYSMTES